MQIYWQHLRRYKAAFALGLAALLIAQLAALSSPLFYKWFFDVLTGGGATEEIASTLIAIIIALAAIYAVVNIFYRIAERSAIYHVTHVMADLANTCFEYIHKHSYTFFTDNFAGSLVKKVNRFYRSYNRIFDKLYWNLIGLALKILVASIVLFFVHPVMGWILSIWSLLFLLIAFIFVRWKLKYDIPRAEADSKVTGVLADTITNFVNVKLFSAHKAESRYFAETIENRRGLQMKAWMVSFYLSVIQGFLVLFVEFALMYYGIKLWTQGLLTVGDFVLIQSYLIVILREVWAFAYVIRDLYEALADAEEMTQIFQTKHEIRDMKGAKPLVAGDGSIRFENVSFNYNKTRRVLNKFNLNIKPGERVALVGPSGSGKTTIVKLIFRLFDVEKGKIFIDDQRICRVTQDSLMKNISLVPQDPIMFHRTLMENIRYGSPGASHQDVVKASKLANCYEFINELPEKYNTYVGERGIKLSGGERQRVAIARAILKNAPILVLDEATSSLDSISESLIQDALLKLMKNRTTIVVAHRLSTIMEMDRIIVMDKGQIVEEGSHEELLKKRGGIYKKLWELQAGGFLGE